MDSHEKAKHKVMHRLGHSCHLRHRTVDRAREMELKALLMQKKLKRELPRLHEAIANAASDDERAQAQREYLTATTNLHHCQQVYSAARRQRVITSNL